MDSEEIEKFLTRGKAGDRLQATGTGFGVRCRADLRESGTPKARAYR